MTVSGAGFLERVFPGDSELASRMRAHDWKCTELGPPESWPENLRVAVSICLSSGFPILLWWGPGFTVLYNDAFIPLLGPGKHPHVLGRPGSECWTETWSTFGPQLEGVRATGTTTRFGDVAFYFDRNVPREEVFVRFTSGPLLAADGETVDGIFTACTETTEQVVAERRLETLRQIGIRSFEVRTAEAAARNALRVLGANARDIAFAALYLVDGAGGMARLVAEAGLPRTHRLARAVSIADGDTGPWPLASALHKGIPHEVAVPEGLELSGGAWPEPATRAVVMPLHEGGPGLLVLGVSPRRVWDASYRTFFEAVASHVGAALGAATAHEASRRAVEEAGQSAQALRDSEKRYRTIVETALEGIWVLDAEARTTYVNPQMASMLGYMTEEMLGTSLFDFMDDEARVDAEEKLQRRRQGIGEHHDFRFRRRDGTVLWARVSTAPIRDEEGRFQGALGMMVDITDSRRMEQALRESERLYRAIGESIDYGVWVCDPAGRNVYASESFLKMVGMTQEQCSDFGWRNVLHPDDAAATVEAWKECVRTEGSWDIELRYLGVDGQWHPVLARGVPVKNEQGVVVCWAGINLDISRLKQTEAALRDGQERLQEEDRQKDAFLALLSHELRNPLTPIRNSLSVLDRAAPGSDAAGRALKVLDRQVGHLSRLVDDLLDLTRISHGKVDLRRERIDLGKVVRHTVEDHGAMFAHAGIEVQLTIDSPLWVQADRTRMAQAIGNLLQNARKFTPAGGRVAIEAEADPAAAEAIVRVRDTGIGIAPEMLDRIFQPFAQAESSLDRARGGLGLGLALVRHLVELHGGGVSVASEGLGRGTVFTLRLPGDAGVPEAQAVGQPESSVTPSLRVLVIEDNVDAAESLRDVLELAGHTVEVAHSGAEGIRLARTFVPDVVLSDIGLPGMDGYEVARALRSDPALHGTALVALTGYSAPEDIATARAAGFDTHLVKPCSPELIERALAAAIATKCQQDGG